MEVKCEKIYFFGENPIFLVFKQKILKIITVTLKMCLQRQVRAQNERLVTLYNHQL